MFLILMFSSSRQDHRNEEHKGFRKTEVKCFADIMAENDRKYKYVEARNPSNSLQETRVTRQSHPTCSGKGLVQ